MPGPNIQGSLPGENPPLLNPGELRVIMDSRLEALRAFIGSGRLHAVDPKGDTPLHIAARMGNLQACDLFIRAGSDPGARNRQDQTPAEVARIEGHGFAADLLFSLLGSGDIELPTRDSVVAVQGEDQNEPSHAFRPDVDLVTESKQDPKWEDTDQLLDFQPETSAQEFFETSRRPAARLEVELAPLKSLLSSTSGDAPDWDLDHSSGEITGDGIGTFESIATSPVRDDDFLKVRGTGRQSVKSSVLPSGTRLAVDPAFCRRWVEHAFNSGHVDDGQLSGLISRCRGNGVASDLRANLVQQLQSAGILVENEDSAWECVWEIASDISKDDLFDGLEAVLTRATRLPGLARFDMTKANETRLLDPLLAAKKELQLGILNSGNAIHHILSDVKKVQEGELDPAMVSMKAVMPTNPDDGETSTFVRAAGFLVDWVSNGRIMDGRQRRQALASLDALDLTLTYYRSIIAHLLTSKSLEAHAVELEEYLSRYELMLEHLIVEHLPFIRRFAARNVEDGEDPEEVFQVAFIGLQRSTRRFNPDLGHRFVVYAQYWMRQSLTRWRADEGAAVRIPVHLQARLVKFDQAVDQLETETAGAYTDRDLATLAGIEIGDVRSFRKIPRVQCDFEQYKRSASCRSDPIQIEAVTQIEMQEILGEMLEDLPERQAEILRMRFGIGADDEMTLEEVGQLYGVTRERIRQLESKALDALAMPQRRRRLRSLLEH